MSHERESVGTKTQPRSSNVAALPLFFFFSSPSMFSQDELLLLSSCAYVSHSRSSRSRQRQNFIIIFFYWDIVAPHGCCRACTSRIGEAERLLQRSRRLFLDSYVTFVPFLKRRLLYWSVQRVCRRACVFIKTVRTPVGAAETGSSDAWCQRGLDLSPIHLNYSHFPSFSSPCELSG